MKNTNFALDSAQQAIVTSTASDIIVVAGAGSGKTKVLIERIRFLLDKGVDASDIVAITFTNMAAEEIQMRLGNVPWLFAGTIHSYANQILIRNNISAEEWQHKDETTQFNKLLELATKHRGSCHRYVLVDEFQDVSENEYNFIMSLNAEHYFFVGDPRQHIYGFKGTNDKFFMNLLEEPSFTSYLLDNNYRCGEAIVREAETQLYKTRSHFAGQKVLAPYRGTVEKKSLDRVIEEIHATKNYKDWFILARWNKEREYVEEQLMQYFIPFVSFKKSETDMAGMNHMLESNNIKVLTIHSAKGLESKNVALVGLNYWKDEERRVNYVGMTRAKKRLVICDKSMKSRG